MISMNICVVSMNLFVNCFVLFVCMDTRPNFVCVDTRPKLCVWIRVPNCVYGYASKLCIYTRPNFVHGYASQINVLIRVPNELFIKVRNECTHARTHNVHVYTRPNFVCVYASQLCVWIRVPSCVYGYASQLECFVWFLCEFYGILWNSMVFCVNFFVKC